MIFLDIETVRSTSAEIISYIASKHLHHGTPEENAKKASDELVKTSLKGIFGELAVVCFAVDNEDPITIARDFADPEGEQNLIRKLNSAFFENCVSIDQTIVAHNIDFDRNFLRDRGLVHCLKISALQHRWHCTYQETKHSLSDLSMAFGFDLKEIDNRLISEYCFAGRVAEVAEYCKNDVIRLRKVYQRLRSFQ